MLIVDRAAVLGIFLSVAPRRELRIGSLLRMADGTAAFLVDDGYLALGERRPLASLAWKGADEPETLARLTRKADKVMGGGLLPPFFQNLLPEGALRDLVEKEFGAGAFDNFDVLARLGHDLPGAIIARLEADTPGRPARERARVEKPAEDPTRIRFSLAGVQLKFSMTLRGGSVTVPAVDGGGEIILKTPSRRHALLPEAELTALRLAEAAGVRTVDAWLVGPEDIQGLPAEFLEADARALAVRRFDRTPGGGRIQIEDFAQILTAIGDAKYNGNEATVMNIVRRFATDSRGEMLEAVRRVVVNILVGNGDAHLKNWSFIYGADGTIELTPAYDLVPTFLYGDDTLALAFGGSKNPYSADLHRFERAAGLMKVDPRIVVKEARLTVERVLDTWPALIDGMPLPEDMSRRILERLPRLRLVEEIRPHFAPGWRMDADTDDAPPAGPARP